MFDRLPHELALLVLEHAVNLLLATDRTALVHLAQTSKTVYNIVAPQMYRSIYVPSDRSSDLIEFAREDSPTRTLAERVLIHARSLHMIDSNPSGPYDNLFQHLELIESHIEVVIAITTSSGHRQGVNGRSSTTLRSVHLCFDLCSTIIRLSSSVRAHLTHLCGYMIDPEFDNLWRIFLADPSDWMAMLLNELPALSHLGLNLYCTYMVSKSRIVAAFDLVAFAQSLRTALTTGNGRLVVIAVRVAGLYVTRWDQILLELKRVDLVDGVATGRIMAWRDDRGQDDQDWDEWIMADALAKRSIWTEALPVASIKQ